MLKYLKEHILEELEGAIDYMQKAVENKANDMGAVFYRMSMMELEHANCMTKMFNKLEKEKDVSEAEYSTMYKSILEAYTTDMGKVESMKKLYWS